MVVAARIIGSIEPVDQAELLEEAPNVTAPMISQTVGSMLVHAAA